jgi:LDH2 family malate/lactate/ureidoglycolate dehydrogenase
MVSDEAAMCSRSNLGDHASYMIARVESEQVDSGSTRIQVEGAQRWVGGLFRAVDVPEADADLVAEVLIGADLRGIRSHGLARVPYFLTRLRRGVIRARPRLSFEPRSPTTGVLEADDGIGIVAASRAMDEAMTMAGEVGSGFVVVKDSSHFGYAGFWAERASRSGLIGISMSNSGGRLAPTFGTESLLGTNPLAVAIPGAPGGTDFLLDMATSAVAVGKVETALREGRAPPPGWVASEVAPHLDANGVLSFESPLLPLGGAGTETGGHKGYGLALMIELLCGALGGTGFAARIAGATGEAPPAMGHLMGAIRIDGFRPVERVQNDMEATFEVIRESSRSPGRDRIYIHGEPEAEAAARHRREGIPVGAEVLAQLDRWAAILGVEPLPR